MRSAGKPELEVEGSVRLHGRGKVKGTTVIG